MLLTIPIVLFNGSNYNEVLTENGKFSNNPFFFHYILYNFYIILKLSLLK